MLEKEEYFKRKPKDISRLVKVALGEEPADLVLKNAEAFQTMTGEFLFQDIAIADGYIAATGSDYFGLREIDLNGAYAVPGLIDAHIHLESTMLCPAEFAKAALSCGVTTVIADPHEIANVKGIDGIKYMLDATEDIPLNVYMTLPACVPSTPLENSGAVLLCDDLLPFLKNPRVIGLGEVMNVQGVLDLEPNIQEKLILMQGLNIDGHATGRMGRELMAYSAAGINSDHECVTVEQARERLRAGMHLFLREGTANQNMKALLPVIDNDTAPFCSFAVDDKIPVDMVRYGYINNMVRRAIKYGISVSTAVQIATINTARYYGLRGIGAIAPGYRADIVTYDASKVNWKPLMVFKDGQKVFDSNISTKEILVNVEKVSPQKVMNEMRIKDIDKKKLELRINGNKAYVIGLMPYQIVTKKFILEVTKVDGYVVSDIEKDILKIAVFERHKATGNVGVGLLKGYGLKRGAIASTVAHDAHNLIVVGTNDDDMICAVKELERIGGGLTIVDNGEVLGSLPLPIAGLMSEEPLDKVAKKQGKLIEMAYKMGVQRYFHPFLTLAYQSLPVTPALKITDQGLVDVAKHDIIPVEVKEYDFW